jgi:HEAT repeat protein
MHTPQTETFKQQLLRFTPMPSNQELEELYDTGVDLATEYASVITAIRMHKDEIGEDDVEEVVVALIRTFGIDDAFEVFWTNIHVIESFPLSVVHSVLRRECHGENPGTRKWCCTMLARFRDPIDIPLLIHSIDDEVVQVRYQALHGLIRYSAQDLRAYQSKIEQIYHHDQNESVREIALELFNKMSQE